MYTNIPIVVKTIPSLDRTSLIQIQYVKIKKLMGPMLFVVIRLSETSVRVTLYFQSTDFSVLCGLFYNVVII
jgi:phosphoribulokinase